MASNRAIDYIVTNIKSPDIEYSRPAFRTVNLSSLNAVTWEGVSFDLRIARNETAKTEEELSIKIGEMTISLESLFESIVLLNAKGVSALTKARSAGAMSGISGAGDYMERGNLNIRIKLRDFSKASVIQQVRDLIKEIHAFSTHGVTRIPLSFSATKMFEIKGNLHKARLFVEQKGDEYLLVMDKDDLKLIAATISGEKVSSMDIDVISRNPIKAPQLLKIRDKAVVTARQARQQDQNVPEDAYRHVLWSYLLVKAYGETFAKEVTDAHEVNADREKMSKEELLKLNIESYQDLHNNAAGRRYAKMGYPESGILRYVLNDDAVIRDENRAARYNASKKEEIINPSVGEETIRPVTSEKPRQKKPLKSLKTKKRKGAVSK
jgi:parvulin-like peptidyl-prolyl isomerase